MSWTVYNPQGQRKYLTKSEMRCFLRAAHGREADVRSFCWILAETGCRISEALALDARNIDFEAGQIIFECLKKRGRRVFRAVPVPEKLLNMLKKWIDKGVLPTGRLWPWSRMTGYRRVREVMQEGGVRGPYATPKGLRHGFGVRAIQASVPLHLVQRWLGHADIKTTAIYTSVMGPEERAIASRMWSTGREAGEPDRAPGAPRRVAGGASKKGLNHLPPMDSPPPEHQEKYCKILSTNNKNSDNCKLIHFWLKCNSTNCYLTWAYPIKRSDMTIGVRHIKLYF
jgi:hypothetical protein